MKYMFLGGANEVGASSLLISIADRHILIDAGIRVNATGSDALPDLETLKKTVPTLDAIFVSHAHADHVGALPLLHTMFPQTKIYATLPTQRLATVMLADAVRVMQTQGETLFTPETVEIALGRMQILPTEQWHPLWNDDWRVKLIPSGHILGAVAILLETPEGRYLFSGDVSTFNQKTIDGINSLEDSQPEFMWCESTYGDSNHPSRTAEEGKLAEAVAAVVKDGGTVLIPSFALGRAQEILLILKQAMRNGNIPTFPIIIDGLVRAISDVYISLPTFLSKKLQNYLHTSRQNIFFSETVRAAARGEREKLAADNVPKCIIASSGMLAGGASVVYAKALASGTQNAIFLSGYQDAESPGRRLQQLQPGDGLTFADGTAVEVKCRVERFHLSAHADQGQLVSLIKQANPKAVALMHGENTARSALREKLYKSFPVTCPANGRIYEGTAHPEWLPPAVQAKMEAEQPINMPVKVNADGSINIEVADAASQRWLRFAETTHRAVLKGNQLVIKKTEISE